MADRSQYGIKTQAETLPQSSHSDSSAQGLEVPATADDLLLSVPEHHTSMAMPLLFLAIPRHTFICDSSDGSTHELSAEVLARKSGNRKIRELGGMTVRAYSGLTNGELLNKMGEVVATLLFSSKRRYFGGKATENEHLQRLAAPHTKVPTLSGKQRIIFMQLQ